MIKIHFRDDEYVRPPGSLTEILSHPHYDGSKSIELSIFSEHRYAFFFWAKWTRTLFNGKKAKNVPSLITLDWHQDLGWPTDNEKEWLKELDTASNEDVSLYTWANLSSLNDTHIMAAVYLNLIGNVYVHCRQGSTEARWEDREFTDRFGNIHLIKKFRKFEDLESHMLQTNEQNVYFDIDLDFFTLNNPYSGKGKEYSYLSQKQISGLLNNKRPLISWIFERLCGFTIATEPEHTGGLLKSNRLLDFIDKLYFSPSLFSNYGDNWEKSCQWKHLPKR